MKSCEDDRDAKIGESTKGAGSSSQKKKNTSINNQELKGGNYVKAHSENFDLIINILIGIRRGLGNLVEVSGIGLDERLYKQKITTETDYISKDSKV